MEYKKKLNTSLRKYGIALKVAILFMLVLGLQMISSPSCYALTSFDEFDSEDMTNILQYFYDLIDNTQYINTSYSSLKTYINNYLNDSTLVDTLTSKFKTSVYNNLGIYLYDELYLENLFFTLDTNGTISCGLSNNTIGNNFKHIEVKFNRLSGGTPQYDIYYIDDNHSIVNSYLFRLQITNSPDCVYYNYSTFGEYIYSPYITVDNNLNIAYYPFLRFFWI